MEEEQRPPPQGHWGALAELAVNIAAPTLVLIFLSGEDRLGPVWSMVLALAFPLGHAAYTLITTRKISPLAGLGAFSVVLTGGIGLLEIDLAWFAWKEAAFPFIIGIAMLVSTRTPWPAVPTLLDPLLDHDQLTKLLEERGEKEGYDTDLLRATWLICAVMLLTAVGTFLFARYMIVSPTGTEAFNTELGRYTAWAFPVLGLPSTLLMLGVIRSVLASVEHRTGKEIEELLR